ncbi:hypothetical protein [Arthrobacter sp. ov407]
MVNENPLMGPRGAARVRCGGKRRRGRGD